MQRLLRAELPGLVPEMFYAYVVQHYQRNVGVVVMARVDGVVHDLIAGHADAADLDDLAGQVRWAVHQLERSGFVHGDLHTQNIGYVRVSAHRAPSAHQAASKAARRRPLPLPPQDADGGCSIRLLDFRMSFPCADDRERLDCFMMWRASLLEATPDWNAALHRTGFPGSHLLQQWGGCNRLLYGHVE